MAKSDETVEVPRVPVRNVEDPSWPDWPVYAVDEIDAANAVLASGRVNYWTGEHGRQFEREFASYIGAEHAVAVCNGSAAIGTALRALRLPQGAEVVVTPRTFVASASEIVLAGARPVFADVDLESQNLTVESIAAVLSEKTAAILVVHLAGWPADMSGIGALAREHDLVVIEDCAQAHGAAIDGRKVGSWGDVATFSFCQDKIMSTCGEGGMLVTGDRDLWARSWSFKDHGKTIESLQPQAPGSRFRWLHESIGTNNRMTELQAAVGRRQLQKLDEWVERRQSNARLLNARFSELEALRTAIPGDGVGHAYYKYYCFIRPERLKSGWSRDRILDELRDRGIPVGSGTCSEVYLEKGLSDLGYGPDRRLPNAKQLGDTSIMLPVHPTMGDEHMERMVDALTTVLAVATR